MIASSGVLMAPLQEEFGWERSTISLGFGISLLFYGLSGPFVAALLEKIGLRKMMIIFMSSLIIGATLTLFVTDAWQFILVWGVIVGFGCSLFLTTLSPFVSSHWFEKRRGLVVGILTASTATGQLLFLPLLAVIITNSSWRLALLTLIVFGIFMLIIICLFMKDKPIDLGLRPFGAVADPIKTELEVSTINPIANAFMTLRLAMKSKIFWLLGSSFFICGFTTNGLIGTHFISYCLSFGIPLLTATSLLSFMGVFNLVGTTLSGALSDKFDNRWLLFIYYFLRGLSLIILPYALYSGNFTLLVIFTIVYGLDWIATVPPTINLTRKRFGIKSTGIVFGWIFAFHQAGAATAAYSGGLVYSITYSYTSAFLFASITCLFACLFVVLIKKEDLIQKA